jgi:hypothetical protein
MSAAKPSKEGVKMPEAIEEIKEGIEPMLSRLEQMIPIIAAIMSGEMKLSWTATSNFIDSPKDFADYKLQKKEPTAAMNFGSMVHCLVLEPGDFDKRFYAFDDTDKVEELIAGGAKSPRATKVYKQWKAQMCEAAGERIIVNPKEYAHAKIIAANIKNNAAAARLMAKCPKRETPVEWEFMNFLFRGFIDLMGDTDICDIKTMPDAQQDKVKREIWYRKLYIQGVMYLIGAREEDKKKGVEPVDRNYHIIAVDKLGGISCHQLDPALLKYGMEEYDKYMKRFNYAILTEAWDMSYDFWSEYWHGEFIVEKASWMW